MCVLHAAPNSRLNAVVVERLVAFTRSSRLERALLNLVAKHLSRSDIGHLEAMFKALDTDGDGRAPHHRSRHDQHRVANTVAQQMNWLGALYEKSGFTHLHNPCR